MAFSWKNLFGTKSQAAIDDAANTNLQHPTAVLVDPATGQPPVGGQPVNLLPFLGDNAAGNVAFSDGAASSATALPASTTRLHLWVTANCFMRLGTGAVAASTSSFPLLANTPYEFQVRAGETYASFWGNGAAGKAYWGRLDAS